MIFCAFGYKNYHNGNKNIWPIQPPTQKNWNEMLRRDVQFCKKLENKTIDWKSITCRLNELPSYHPYWNYMVRVSMYNSLKDKENKLEQCIKNPFLFKYYFNATASSKSVTTEINLIREGLNYQLYGPKEIKQNK